MKSIGQILDHNTGEIVRPPSGGGGGSDIRCFPLANGTVFCATHQELADAGYREFTAGGRRVGLLALCADAVTGDQVYPELKGADETHEQTIARTARDRAAMRRCEGSKPDSQRRRIKEFDE